MIYNCLTVACIFGICPLIEKYILNYINIETFITISATFFFIIVMIYTIFSNTTKLQNDLVILNNHHHLYALILIFVLLFYFAAHFIYLHVLQKHKPTHVTMVIATFPFITAFIAFLFFDEDINFIQMISMFVAITAIYYLETN